MERITPKYMTVKETAEAWGVSKRWVNMCIEKGTIPGVRRKGNIWLIPRDTENPSSRRKKLLEDKSFSLSAVQLSLDLANFIEATTQPMPHDNPDAILGIMKGERIRRQYQAELAYMRGDYEQTICCYREIKDDDIAKLRVTPMVIASAMSIGDYQLYTEIESFLKDIISKHINNHISTVAELMLSTAYLNASAPNMILQWLKDGDFSSLPYHAIPGAAYMRVKYFKCVENYEAMLTLAQTALAFCVPKRGITLHCVYLQVACAVACYALNHREEAKRYLSEALDICLPHRLIVPLAESLAPLGELLETCLKQQYPEYHDAVITEWEGIVTNRVTFHNLFTKDNIMLVLPLRDYQVARLVAQGLSYATVAERLRISETSVKSLVQSIYDKLLITGTSRREELAKYLL